MSDVRMTVLIGCLYLVLVGGILRYVFDHYRWVKLQKGFFSQKRADELAWHHKRIDGGIVFFGISGALATYANFWPWSFAIAPILLVFVLLVTKKT